MMTLRTPLRFFVLAALVAAVATLGAADADAGLFAKLFAKCKKSRCFQPAPVCCEPAPACCEPEPVCCEPAPVCCEPAPTCCEPAPADCGCGGGVVVSHASPCGGAVMSEGVVVSETPSVIVEVSPADAPTRAEERPAPDPPAGEAEEATEEVAEETAAGELEKALDSE